MDPLSVWLQAHPILSLVLVAAPAAALVIAAAPLLRVEMRTSDARREAVVGIRLRATNVVVVVLALVAGALLVSYAVAELAYRIG